MKDYSVLDVQQENGIVIITINRPHALNALNNDVFEELIDCFNSISQVKSIRGVLITGSGEKAFAAGADIKEFMSLDQSSAMELSRRGQNLFNAIEAFHIPVIAAVNGFALGGGCELAMACHMRIASTNAKFGQPELSLGILPGYGGTQRLTQLIGKSKAMEITLTGDFLNAEEALKLGLANHVCDPGQLLELSKSFLAKIAKKAPLAISESIGAINACFAKDIDGYDIENEAFGRLAQTADFKEGASAFIEKRKASFLGK